MIYLQWPLSLKQSKPSLRHSGSIHSLLHDPSPNLSLHFLLTGHWPHGSPDAAVRGEHRWVHKGVWPILSRTWRNPKHWCLSRLRYNDDKIRQRQTTPLPRCAFDTIRKYCYLFKMWPILKSRLKVLFRHANCFHYTLYGGPSWPTYSMYSLFQSNRNYS